MRILYLCTHNSCRSILAEAITRAVAGDKIIAASAGSNPSGHVHPLTLKYLLRRGIDTTALRSQSWDDFTDFHPHAVITLCDSAAEETCPIWFADSVTVHWGLPDPSKIKGSDHLVDDAFDSTIDALQRRVQLLLEKELDSYSPRQLDSFLRELA